MIVDPTFMTIQTLRPFLTAVTPTAVAPTAVILWIYVIYRQFRHTGTLQMTIPGYLHTCVLVYMSTYEFVYLSTYVLVYLCTCVLVY